MTQETDGMYHSRTSRPILVDNAVQSGVVGRRGVGIRFDEEDAFQVQGDLSKSLLRTDGARQLRHLFQRP